MRALLVLSLLAMTGLAAACGAEGEVDGCNPPPGEERLINKYRNEPIFRAVPPDSIIAGGMQASKACRRVGPNGVSRTVVSQRYELPAGYRTSEIGPFYVSASISSGWWRMGDRDAPKYPKYPSMSFCKMIESVTSYLNVTVQPIQPVDGSPPAHPDELIVSIEAAPDQSSCLGSG